MLLFKNQQNPKTHSKFKKKPKKNISFLKSISTLKFLTTKFLRCNIYQLSNDNINHVPKANLPKQNHSSWLFVQKFQKKTKKKLKPKSTKTTAVLLYDFFPIIRIFFFVNEQNCLLHSLKFLFFCQYLFHNDVQYF